MRPLDANLRIVDGAYHGQLLWTLCFVGREGVDLREAWLHWRIGRAFRARLDSGLAAAPCECHRHRGRICFAITASYPKAVHAASGQALALDGSQLAASGPARPAARS
jgi:hypothetical protein